MTRQTHQRCFIKMSLYTLFSQIVTKMWILQATIALQNPVNAEQNNHYFVSCLRTNIEQLQCYLNGVFNLKPRKTKQ